jgi:signal transduction histidine kinase
VRGNGRGAGLGLALCRRIVERHGGMIWAERGADGGLVVRFELPEG